MSRWLALALCCASLSACGTSTREDEWRCAPQPGLGCVSIADADGPRPTAVVKAGTPSLTAAGAEESFVNRIIRTMGRSTVTAAEGDGSVRRVPDQVARMYMAPQEVDGSLVEGTFVWLVLVPSHWQTRPTTR